MLGGTVIWRGELHYIIEESVMTTYAAGDRMIEYPVVLLAKQEPATSSPKFRAIWVGLRKVQMLPSNIDWFNSDWMAGIRGFYDRSY
jgi:hypothetical protein